MKIITANKVRSRYMTLLMNYLTSQEEDIALISSNVANMPFVEDGEEGILEISVKVSKKDYDYASQSHYIANEICRDIGYIVRDYNYKIISEDKRPKQFKWSTQL